MNNIEWEEKVSKLCSPTSIQSLPPVGHKMNLEDFMSFDDVANSIVVDILLGIRTHKMKPKNVFLKNTEMIKCYQFLRQYLETFNVHKTIQNLFLINSMKSFCINKDWKQLIELRNHIHRYLTLFQPNSGICIQKCFKYSRENFIGAKLIATRKFKTNECINMLYGVVKPLSEEQIKKLIQPGINDFSIMISDRNDKQILWLGPGSFLNHDCNSNIKFDCRGKHTVVLIATKNIEIGEELFLNYGNDYFGENNKECQCDSCEDVQRKNSLKWIPLMCKEINENFVECLEIISLRNVILKKIFDFQIPRNNLIISLNYISEFLKYGFIEDSIFKASSKQSFIDHILEYIGNLKKLINNGYNMTMIEAFIYFFIQTGYQTTQGKIGTTTTRSISLERNEAIFKYASYETIFGAELASDIITFQTKLFEQYHYENISISQIIYVINNFVNILRTKNYTKIFQEKITLQNKRISELLNDNLSISNILNSYDLRIDLFGIDLMEKKKKYIESCISSYSEPIPEELKSYMSLNFLFHSINANEMEAKLDDLKDMPIIESKDKKDVKIVKNKGVQKIRTPLSPDIDIFNKNNDNYILLNSLFKNQIEEISHKIKKSKILKIINITEYISLDENKPKNLRSSTRLTKQHHNYQSYNIESFYKIFYINKNLEKFSHKSKRNYVSISQDFFDNDVSNIKKLKNGRIILKELK